MYLFIRILLKSILFFYFRYLIIIISELTHTSLKIFNKFIKKIKPLIISKLFIHSGKILNLIITRSLLQASGKITNFNVEKSIVIVIMQKKYNKKITIWWRETSYSSKDITSKYWHMWINKTRTMIKNF